MASFRAVVTGGAGFIGSALIRNLLSGSTVSILNIDKLTYAGNLNSIPNDLIKSNYRFENVDIIETEKILDLFIQFQPNIVFNLAAESHVDNSINSPGDFIKTNINGTYSMLEATRLYWNSLDSRDSDSFRFIHISTDEVFGDLEDQDTFFNETTSYKPSSPYSASKASSDHLVRSWHRTYDLPTIVTNCSNNYGPYQNCEKLIPVIINCLLNEQEIPIYGSGNQIRDWLYVDDHISALIKIALNGEIGSDYVIGGGSETSNIEVANKICKIFEDKKMPKSSKINYFTDLIEFVEDRPGHDFKYAIDCSKLKSELNWFPKETFESGLIKTINWYLGNKF